MFAAVWRDDEFSVAEQPELRGLRTASVRTGNRVGGDAVVQTVGQTAAEGFDDRRFGAADIEIQVCYGKTGRSAVKMAGTVATGVAISTKSAPPMLSASMATEARSITPRSNARSRLSRSVSIR